MNPILSIITPNYNSFHLLTRSLDQFKRWNNVNIEWIIVDDCSTDDSYIKLKEYKKQNVGLNINIYQNESNSGPGVARNLGVKMSHGKYITFLDSDDFFEDSFWSVVEPEIKIGRDCIIVDSFFYYNDNNKRYWSLFKNGQPEGLVKTEDAIVHVIGAPWGKIYKREIIINNRVLFLPQKRNEDMPFTKHAISCCRNIIYIKKSLYNYVQQDNSLMHDEFLRNFDNTKNAFNYIIENISSKFSLEIEALYISTYLYSLALISFNKMSKKEYLNTLKDAEQMYPNYYSNKYLKESPLQLRLIIFCVKHKLYSVIKLTLWLRKIRNRKLYRTE